MTLGITQPEMERLTVQAEAAQALFTLFSECASEALNALDRDDTSTLFRALDGCEALLREIDPLVASLTTARMRHGGDRRNAESGQRLERLLHPVERAAREAQQLRVRVAERVGEVRDQMSRELAELEQHAALAAALTAGRRPRRLDLYVQ